jgi:hypothetical protein
MTPGRDLLLRRLERDTLVIGGLLTLIAWIVWPDRPGRALGVAGGVALIGVGYYGIRAGIDAIWATQAAAAAESLTAAPAAGQRRRSSPAGFVKFFTRHAILAVGAYVMIARFEFDPVAMLAGVTAPAAAGGVEFVRTMRARPKGTHSRFS